jgi:chemosensory pili system protein ChpA (sensor histidine kinase/response regulator)
MFSDAKYALVADFCAEVLGFLPQIEAALAAFADDPSNRLVLDPAYRHTHTLKGAATMLELTPLSQVAERLEHGVEGLAAGWITLAPELLDLLMAGYLAVREYMTALKERTPPATEFLDDLIAGFDAVLPPRPPGEPSLEVQADMATMEAEEVSLPPEVPTAAEPTVSTDELPLPFDAATTSPPPALEEPFDPFTLDEVPAASAPPVEVAPPAPEPAFDPFTLDGAAPPAAEPAPSAPPTAEEPFDPFALDDVPAPNAVTEPPALTEPAPTEPAFDPFVLENLVPSPTDPVAETPADPVFDPFGFDDLATSDLSAAPTASSDPSPVGSGHAAFTRTVYADDMTVFCNEAEEVLLAMESSLTAYQADPKNTDALESAYKNLHNLKGAAGTLGLDELYQPLFFATDLLLDVAGEQVQWSQMVADTYAELLGAVAGYVGDIRAGVPTDMAIFALLEQRLRELRTLPATGAELPAFDELELGADLPGLAAVFAPAESALPVAASAPEPLPSDIPPELMEIFLEEAEGHIRIITGALPQLQKNPGDRTTLLTVRRSVHTLKGAAGMVKFTAVSQLAHRLEDLLDELAEGQRQPTPEIIKLIFASCDALEDLPKGQVDNARLQSLYRDLATLLDGKTPAAAPAPVVKPAKPVVSPMQQPPALDPAVQEALLDPKLTDTMRTAMLPTPVPTREANIVRVPAERLDMVVRLLSELVITRTALELRLTDFRRQLDDLAVGAQRLRQVSGKLESEYEASALGRDKGGSGSGAGPTILPGRTYDFDELEFDRYTEFHLLTRSLGETSSDVQAVGGELGQLGADFETLVNRQARLTSEIEDKLRQLRMTPLSGIVMRLSRSVRNAAETVGKSVEFLVEGDRTELDRTVLEELTDPLVHLVRNAVDHGIEKPAERRAAGKSEKGTVRLKAYNEGRQVIIELADDGKGIDVTAVRATAVRKNVITAEEAERLSTAEAYNLILLPGFSTATAITELSGRGVGLDVVRSEVQRLKGTLTVQSEPGRGTTFVLRLPLTLAIARCLLVKSNGQTFALPLDAVKAILRAGPSERELVGEAPVVRIGAGVYPLVPLGRVLHLKQPNDSTVEHPPVILLRAGAQDVALQVDYLLGAREVVVKNLGTHLRRVNGISGATLLGDGTVVLILNPTELSGRATPELLRGPSERPTELPSAALNILVVDDSPSVRRVMTNILKTNGMHVLVAKDGVEGVETVNSGERIDAVLLDVEMPRMDGYEFLRTLRSDPNQRDLPVIMATSRVSAKHKQKALDLGANDYLVKPFQDDVLIGTIRRLVRPTRGSML